MSTSSTTTVSTTFTSPEEIVTYFSPGVSRHLRTALATPSVVLNSQENDVSPSMEKSTPVPSSTRLPHSSLTVAAMVTSPISPIAVLPEHWTSMLFGLPATTRIVGLSTKPFPAPSPRDALTVAKAPFVFGIVRVVAKYPELFSSDAGSTEPAEDVHRISSGSLVSSQILAMFFESGSSGFSGPRIAVSSSSYSTQTGFSCSPRTAPLAPISPLIVRMPTLRMPPPAAASRMNPKKSAVIRIRSGSTPFNSPSRIAKKASTEPYFAFWRSGLATAPNSAMPGKGAPEPVTVTRASAMGMSMETAVASPLLKTSDQNCRSKKSARSLTPLSFLSKAG